MTHKEIGLVWSYGQPATLKIVGNVQGCKGHALTRQLPATFRMEPQSVNTLGLTHLDRYFHLSDPDPGSAISHLEEVH